MLEIRPNCEYCDKDLAPNSVDARICSYECTFCSDCVKKVLNNVCPNCGGGFVARPVRPSQEHRAGVSLNHQAASKTRVHTKYDRDQILEFSSSLLKVQPEQR